MASLRIVVFTVGVFAAALQLDVVISAPSEEPESWTSGQITLRPQGKYFSETFSQPYCQCVNPRERAHARFPNRRNQFAKEAESEFADFTRINRNVIESGCSNKIGTLLCFFYFPLSVADDEDFSPEILPCRDLCEEVRRDCEARLIANRFQWPAHLNCSLDYFRPSGLCVDGTDPDQGYAACMRQATVEPLKPTTEPPGELDGNDERDSSTSTMSGSGKEDPEPEGSSCDGECATDPPVTSATSGPRGNTSTPQPATITTSTPSTDSTTSLPPVTTVPPVTTESTCDRTQCPSCSRLRTNCNGGTFLRNAYTWAARVIVLRSTVVDGNKAYLVHVQKQYLPDPERAEEMEELTVIHTTNPECCNDCPARILPRHEYLFSGYHDTDPLTWTLDIKGRGGLVSKWTSKYTRNLADWIARRN